MNVIAVAIVMAVVVVGGGCYGRCLGVVVLVFVLDVTGPRNQTQI